MKTKSFILIALLVAAFSFPAEAQVKVKVSAKGLLNAVAKEAEKAEASATEKEGTRTTCLLYTSNKILALIPTATCP